MPADPTREESAAHRRAAREMFAMFNSLVAEGFSETQALSLVGTLLAAAASRPTDPDA